MLLTQAKENGTAGVNQQGANRALLNSKDWQQRQACLYPESANRSGNLPSSYSHLLKAPGPTLCPVLRPVSLINARVQNFVTMLAVDS